MSTRPLPPYLKVVPTTGKRFRRPSKAASAPLALDGEPMARLIRQAERVEAVMSRLLAAAALDDELVVHALADVAMVEAAHTARLARNLREGRP